MHTSLIPLRTILTLGVLTITAACSSSKTDQPADSAGAGAGASAAIPASAQGTSAVKQDTLGPKADALLQRLQSTNADSLRVLLVDDRQVVTGLIAECEQMMRQMKMDPPRKWLDLVKNLRADLDRMPGMTGPQLTQAMPEHRKRIADMLGMRRDMMRM